MGGERYFSGSNYKKIEKEWYGDATFLAFSSFRGSSE